MVLVSTSSASKRSRVRNCFIPSRTTTRSSRPPSQLHMLVMQPAQIPTMTARTAQMIVTLVP